MSDFLHIELTYLERANLVLVVGIQIILIFYKVSHVLGE